jgi:hypothetical protein
MYRRLFFLVVVLSPLLAQAREKPENWVEVRSPHFSVVSNSNEKQAHRVADQFEHMRSVFHTLFPKIQIDTLGSITVLAIKDEKDFRALEPADLTRTTFSCAWMPRANIRMRWCITSTPIFY